MEEPTCRSSASKRRCCQSHPLVTESKKHRIGTSYHQRPQEDRSLLEADLECQAPCPLQTLSQGSSPAPKHTPSITSGSTYGNSSTMSSTATTPYHYSHRESHQGPSMSSKSCGKGDQPITHCAEPEPCTDPSCLDVCTDLIPCQAQEDCSIPHDCFSFPCWDQDCVTEFGSRDICCDEECPQETRCASPHCYSVDCNIPVCESFCPSVGTSTCHADGFDDQSFCNFLDPHMSSCIPHCGCIDPQCLLQSHYSCEDPKSADSYPGMPVEYRHFDAALASDASSYRDHVVHGHIQGFAVQHHHRETYGMTTSQGAEDSTTDLNVKVEPTSTESIESKVKYRLTAFSRDGEDWVKPASFRAIGSEPCQGLHTCQWSLKSSKAEADHGSRCGMSFQTPEELHQHVEKSHVNSLHREDQTGNGFFCHWIGCDRYMCRSFQARPKLKRHVQTHTVYKPFTCSLCGIQMKTKDAMEKHERTHTGERPYECTIPECGKVFATSTELKTHMTIHEGRKPHQCPICQECFADSSNLSKHKKTHFAGRYVCPECGARMKRWDQMRRHIATQEHALELLHDIGAQRDYKARMDKEFNEMPERHKVLARGMH